MTSLADLARQLNDLDRRVRAMSAPQLAYSSIEDGNVQEYDGDDTLVGIIGKQFDGTHIAASVNGPIPPRPGEPTVTAGVESLVVAWNGLLDTAGVFIPMDFLRVDVHMSAAGSGFTPDDSTRIGAITSPRGGELTIARPAGVEFWFKLVMVSQSGKMSTPSGPENGTALSVGASSDGSAPTDPPSNIRLDGSVGVLVVRWTPVLNTDPVRYKVYIGTTPGFAINDATNLVADTAGSQVTIRSLMDGTPLDYGVTYYVVVLPYDADGENATLALSDEVSGQMHQVTGPDVSVEYVYTGTILFDQAIGGTLNADVTLAAKLTTRTEGVGPGVDIDANGEVIYDPSGVPATVLTPENSKFKGEVEAQNLTVIGGAAFRSTAEVSRSATLMMQQGATQPQSPPSVVVGWPDPIVEPLFSGNYGLTWTGTDWATVGDSAPPLIQTHASTDVALPSTAPRPWGGITKIGTDWYVLGFSGNPAVWYVTKYNSSGVQQAQAVYTPIDGPWGSGGSLSGALAPAAIGNDGTNILVAEFDDANNRFRIQTRSPSTLAVSSTLNTAANGGFSGPVVGVRSGTFDFGVSRIIILSRNGQHFWPFDSAGTYQPNDAWSAPVPGSMSGFDWDGGRFWSTRAKSIASNAWVYKHTTDKWSGADPQTRYAASTWRDTDATGGTHETDMSPVASFPMKKRAAVTLTSPAIPDTGGTDDPNAVSFYLGKVDTGRLNMWRQALPADGVNTLTVGDGVTFAGTNPPASNNFPAAVPGVVRSFAIHTDALPKFTVDGSGAGRWLGENWHVVGSGGGEPAFVSGWSNVAGSARFRKDPLNNVWVQGSITATGTPTDVFTLPVEYRPTQNLDFGLKANADGGTVAWVRVNTSGVITLLGNNTAARVRLELNSIVFSTR
jgi:hypothetical protein